jgi:serine phosphatase RsbU (regulator of sigma subunit)/PAS domain-containing protein
VIGALVDPITSGADGEARGLRARLAQRGDGFSAGFEEAHRGVDPRQLQQAPDLGSRTADGEVAVVVSEPAPDLDQEREPGGVDEPALTEVDEHGAVAGVDRFVEGPPQLGRGRLVELPDHVHRPSALERLGLDSEIDAQRLPFDARDSPETVGERGRLAMFAAHRGRPGAAEPRMESVTGKPPVRVALMGAWRRHDWLGLILGLITLAIIGAADAALGLGSPVLVGAFVAAPFVCALFARVAATVLAGVAALGLAAASGAWHEDWGGDGYWIALAIIGVGTLFAAASSWNRERSHIRGERLRILDAVATIADGSRPLDETLDTVTELIVPSVADICMIDAIHPGGVTRAAVRAWGHPPRAEEVESRLRRHPSSLPSWLATAERHWRHIPRWRPRVREEELRRMARSDDDFDFLSSLGIRSMLVVPITARHRSLGALTLLSARSGRHYTEDDVRFAQIAARRIGLALDNAGLFSDLESVERRMDTVMSILDEAVMIHARDGELVFANPAAARTMGFDSPEALLATPVERIGERLAIRDESGRPLGPEALTGGRAVQGEASSLIVRVTDPRRRREGWFRVRSQPIEGPEGLALYSVTAIEDVTDVKRAEFAQALLARTGELLASSTDYWRTLDEVAHLVVPELADWCGVYVPAPGGRIEQVAAAHIEPGRAASAGERRERPAIGFDGDTLAEVIRTGRPQMVEVGDELVAGIERPDEPPRRPQGADAGSALLVPMVAGARVVGALTFINETGSRAFDAGDLEVAVELGRRAGLAVENARIAGERARVAEVLQRELLPPDVPEMDGWEVATMYRAAGEMTEVGGDFYEVFPVGDDWVVILGDVSGHGALAASLTGVARHTIRTATTLAADPAVALGVLDERLRERDAVALCSVAVLLLPRKHGEEDIEAQVWLAGHPRPFVLHDGTPTEIGAPGPLVGIGEVPAWEMARVILRPGDQLVIYTDGVTEARRPDGDMFGVDRLRQRLASCAEPSMTVARVESAVSQFSPGEPKDDATLVAIRRTASPVGRPVDGASGAVAAAGERRP